MEAITDFIASKQFWIYHGFVLSGLWVLGSALGIFFKRFSTTLHALTFAIVDFTTLFFAGAALYRVFPHISQYPNWSLIKTGHVFGGSLFLVLIICQHLGGVIAFVKGQANPQHRSFGRILANIGRTIAGVGWVLGGHMQYAIAVGVASVILLVLSLGSKEKKPVSQDRSRSKSPKGKRE